MQVEVKYGNYVCRATEQGIMSISKKNTSITGDTYTHLMNIKIDREKNRNWLTEIVCDNLRSFIEDVKEETFYPNYVVVVV